MPRCDHDVRVQKDGSKFCQKCFSELPVEAKVDDYAVKLRLDKIKAKAKRKQNVDVIVDRSNTKQNHSKI
jgi:hypothetical protein